MNRSIVCSVVRHYLFISKGYIALLFLLPPLLLLAGFWFSHKNGHCLHNVFLFQETTEKYDTQQSILANNASMHRHTFNSVEEKH